MKSIFIYLLLLFSFGDAIYINITSHEQYACVMRSEEYVDWNGNVGQTPSLFIGLLYISVVSLDPPTIQTVLWHQVSFAINATINGPATEGMNPPLSAMVLPLITLANTQVATGSANCPIIGNWVVDAFFMDYLRSSRLFCQIDTGTNTGNLRGQIYSKYPTNIQRRDLLVTFIGDQAENGMGIFRAHKVPAPAPKDAYVYLDYWILSKISSSSAIFQANQAGEGFLPIATFVSNSDGSEEDSLLVKRWISLPTEGPVLPIGVVFTGYPLVGPGSSLLILNMVDADTVTVFNRFYALAYYTDSSVFDSNASIAYDPPHVDFVGSSLYSTIITAGVMVGFTLTFMLLVYYIPKLK